MYNVPFDVLQYHKGLAVVVIVR